MLIVLLILTLITLPNICAVDYNATDDALISTQNDFSALSLQINNSKDSKIVKLSNDYKYDSNHDLQYADGIEISFDDMVIDGNGHTVDGSNKARIFNINAKNVVLKNINIINGFSNNNGGAIYWKGTNASLINSTISDSTSMKYAGGVVFRDSASIINSNFINNAAASAGGIDCDSETTIINCKFINNKGTYIGGGACLFSQTNIFNSSFDKNQAGDGAGIYCSRGIISNCEFNSNYAIGYGAGITSDGIIFVKNSKFIKNIAKYAGSILFKGDGYVENSLFGNNVADIGGAIMGSDNIEITSSTFLENSAVAEAGAIFIYKNAKIENSIFTQNTADKAGAIKIDGNSITINNTCFNHNIAKNTTSLFIKSGLINLENLIFNNQNSSYESEIFSENGEVISKNLSFNKIPLPSKGVSLNNNVSSSNLVKKAIVKTKTKITAKSKTFKSKVKIKKFSVTLKSSKNAVLKNKKIKLKIRNKVYSAKTNKKGKAVFKIKLFKKGKFKVKISFNGDKLFKSTNKYVFIKIK